MTPQPARRAALNPGGTWIVLSRDVSGSVRIGGEPKVWVGMVVDQARGLIRGVAAATTETEAVAQALKMGLTKEAGSPPPGLPDEVLCASRLRPAMVEILRSLGVDDGIPTVRTVEPPAGAEDIVDSFVGHMSGRPQPDDPPSPSDWALLYRCALDFYSAEPWARWHDGVVLGLVSDMQGSDGGCAAVVMGNSGIQRGLVLYPGDGVPAGLSDWEPGRPVPMPPGTVSLMLDLPSELPLDLLNKALRYGWPPDAGLVPVVLRLGPEGAGDAGEADARLMAVALAAVTAHDARGLVAVGGSSQATKGNLTLGDGRTTSFSIAQKPPAPRPRSLAFSPGGLGPRP